MIIGGGRRFTSLVISRAIIDREQNRHAAFGLGIHRCIGSHLARMEMRVALSDWLARFPEF
jgi:cytochrome P450